MAKASVESVFRGAAEGGADGTLLSPGVEGVHVLLGGSQASVSVEAIRKVYQEQGWEEDASLNLEQFTLLWTATDVDGSGKVVQQREDLPVTGKVGEGSGDVVVPQVESVFCRAAHGGAEGSLHSPGVEGVHVLLASVSEAVSVESIRQFYQEQKWDEKMSLDLKQFTLLWTATVVEGGDEFVHEPEDPNVASTIVDSLGDSVVESGAKETFATARAHIAAAGKDKSMETAIREELKSEWETMMEKVPASVKGLMGSSAFEEFVTEKWSIVAGRLETEAKKDAGAVVFVPKISVEFGATDDSVVQARRHLLSHMNSERNQALDVHLCEQWAHYIRVHVPADVAPFVPKQPSQEFLEAHYYEYMMKLFGGKSESTERCQPSSPEAQSVKSDVGMRGVLQKRPPVKRDGGACAPLKEWNCHDLLQEQPGNGLQWRLTCILLHAGEVRHFKTGGAAAAIGAPGDGPSSPKRSRVEAPEKDRVVMDCVLADNTGPLLATFWDECAKQVQELMAAHGVGTTLCIRGFKMMPLKEGEWNGQVCTRIHVLHSLPPLKGEATTVIKYVVGEEARSPNLTTAMYKMPSGPVLIENFTFARSYVTVPFRATVKGFVMDRAEDYSVSQKGNPLRYFSLMDRQGAYISCIAFDRHTDDDTLSNNTEVVVYFGTGRASIGNVSSGMYLYNDAVVVKCSSEVPRVWKQSLVEFPERPQ